MGPPASDTDVAGYVSNLSSATFLALAALFAGKADTDALRIKTLAGRHASGDLVPELAQTAEVNSPHLNSLAFDGFTLMTGTFPGGAVWVSYDKGLSWQSMGKPAGDAAVDDIAYIKAARPGVFYAGCSNTGGPSKLYKSTDSGATWTLAWTAPSAADATEGLSIECVGRTVIIGGFNRTGGTNASIWRSTDDGATFTRVSTTSASGITIRQIRHLYNSVYIAGVYSASPNQLDIYRSSDGGATWAVTATLASVDAYSAVALPNGGVLLGTHPSGKIYRSTNFGQTPYTQVADLGLGPGQSQVMGLTRIGNAILAFVSRNGNAEAKAYMSGDNGTTWTDVATLDATYHYHEPIAVDARTVIATGTNNGGTGTRGVMFRMSWYG